MIPLQFVQQNQGDTPEDCLNRQNAQFRQSVAAEHIFGLRYTFEQYYLPENSPLDLCALICLQRVGEAVSIRAAVVEADDSLVAALAECEPSPGALEALLAQRGAGFVDLSAPLVLEPVIISKPWGREIWYTGIEARGLSQVLGDTGAIPLPWLLSLAPQRLAGGLERQITLLKILDPLPEAVFGDLYFEMHEQKQEVYVVTCVDPDAWPDGQGGIRFGFSKTKRAEYPSEQAFKAAYLGAVQDYERVRRAIDARLDQFREEAGIALDAPVSADTIKQWLSRLPDEQLAEEARRRAAMDAFTELKPLSLGDVVKVPCLTPHSLQHGVQTVEFQTPVYERQILAFGQKVLTQSHWDTAAALEKVSVETPEAAPLVVLDETEGCRVEQVVDFDDFEVHRYTLAAGSDFCLPAIGSYALLMVVTGSIGAESLAPESEAVNPTGKLAAAVPPLVPQQACLLSRQQSACGVRSADSEETILLLALPKQ